MRGVIRLNYPISHGDRVTSAAPNSKVMGLPVARKGDRCICQIVGHQWRTHDPYFSATYSRRYRCAGVADCVCSYTRDCHSERRCARGR
ncbi:MAG: PAAR domain-containing protein [Collimonas sp.]|uniref:PAAR domain-containing protein n=1 Tax=Collimonas sp. TaxID=1963772 RepID=UPI003264F2B9